MGKHDKKKHEKEDSSNMLLMIVALVVGIIFGLAIAYLLKMNNIFVFSCDTAENVPTPVSNMQTSSMQASSMLNRPPTPSPSPIRPEPSLTGGKKLFKNRFR